MKRSKKLKPVAVETISKLNANEMRVIKGGILRYFTSLSHICSHRFKCERLRTICWGSGYANGQFCEFEDEILNT